MLVVVLGTQERRGCVVVVEGLWRAGGGVRGAPLLLPAVVWMGVAFVRGVLCGHSTILTEHTLGLRGGLFNKRVSRNGLHPESAIAGVDAGECVGPCLAGLAWCLVVLLVLVCIPKTTTTSPSSSTLLLLTAATLRATRVGLRHPNRPLLNPTLGDLGPAAGATA